MNLWGKETADHTEREFLSGPRPLGSARFDAAHPYYELARRTGAALANAGFTVMTGGGPGVMEAANRGAREAGGGSVGCNIVVLIQTHKMKMFPVVLLGSEYWHGLISFFRDTLIARSTISREDFDRLIITDDPEQAVQAIRSVAMDQFGLSYGPRARRRWWLGRVAPVSAGSWPLPNAHVLRENDPPMQRYAASAPECACAPGTGLEVVPCHVSSDRSHSDRR